MPASRLGRRLLPLPDRAIHAHTPDDYRRDVTSPTPRTDVEVCRDAGCAGAVVDTPHTKTGHHQGRGPDSGPNRDARPKRGLLLATLSSTFSTTGSHWPH
jgi:hypothetical protein